MTVMMIMHRMQSAPEEDLQPILREEVEIAVAARTNGKFVGCDNITAELVQAEWGLSLMF